MEEIYVKIKAELRAQKKTKELDFYEKEKQSKNKLGLFYVEHRTKLNSINMKTPTNYWFTVIHSVGVNHLFFVKQCRNWINICQFIYIQFVSSGTTKPATSHYKICLYTSFFVPTTLAAHTQHFLLSTSLLFQITYSGRKTKDIRMRSRQHRCCISCCRWQEFSYCGGNEISSLGYSSKLTEVYQVNTNKILYCIILRIFLSVFNWTFNCYIYLSTQFGCCLIVNHPPTKQPSPFSSACQLHASDISSLALCVEQKKADGIT